MILFPAIDILDGKAVRLLKGRREDVTVYGDPVEIAAEYAREGAEFLHVVDLNGAFGDGGNLETVKKIVAAAGIPVQLGGGIRSADAADRAINETGVNRVILGTVLYTGPAVADECLSRFGAERVVAGIDARDGKLAVSGWLSGTAADAFGFACGLKQKGFVTAVYTDISRDGTLEGSNIPATSRMRETGLQIIASGGLQSLQDITALKALGVYGAILGKALYEKRFTLREAFDCNNR